MIITHSREKLINAVLYFAQKTKKCGKTKLMKLLYLLDFQHFKETGKPVTDLEYLALDFGPVPKAFYEEISSSPKQDLKSLVTIAGTGDFPGDFQKISPQKGKKPDMDFFSPREKKLLEKIVYVYKDVNAEEISEISHLPDQPWDKTKNTKGMYSLIDYILAIDDKAAEELPREIAQERYIERQEMLKNYGVVS
jgi:uncharacterized phage-associated protein